MHNKELIAIVNALEHQRIYAQSCSKLTIYTNYKNLVQFITTKTLNRQQVCWLELLGQYKFKILYILGKDNSRADTLSCRSDLARTKTINKFAILRKNADRLLGLS